MSGLAPLARRSLQVIAQHPVAAGAVGLTAAAGAVVLFSDRKEIQHIRKGIAAAATNGYNKLPWVAESNNRAQVDSSRAPSPSDVSKTARSIFDRVDADHDGTMTRREILSAMGSPAFRGSEAATLVALNEQQDAIEDLSNDERFLETRGITKKDLDAFERLKPSATIDGEANGEYYTAMGRINTADRRLFPRGSVAGTDVEQGGLGDCYYVAALAGLANTQPDAITRMIKDNGNGTYTVSYPGRRPVTVTAPTDAEIGRGASAANGLWVPVMEKAYAQTANPLRVIWARGDRYKAIEGGYTGQGLRRLTGSATLYPVALLSERRLTSTLSTALSAGGVVTASTNRPWADSTKDGYVTKHVYTVTASDTASNQITVRNPWGGSGKAISAAEFKRNFMFVSVNRGATRNP